MPEKKSRVVLTPTQRRVCERIEHKLAELNNSDRVILVLSGLSGVGKSEVIESLTGALHHHGVGVLNTEKEIAKSRHDRLLMPVTPGQRERILRKTEIRSLRVIEFILPGMNEAEIQQFAAINGTSNRGSLHTGELKKFSLGIPTLYQQLLGFGITVDVAARISASYLTNSLLPINPWRMMREGELGKYLQIIPEKELAAWFSNINEPDITLKISKILEVVEEYRLRGIAIESPLFICPESYGIYEKTSKTDSPQIVIIIPEHDVQLENFLIGHTGQGNTFDNFVNRLAIFGATQRKVGIYCQSPDGNSIYKGEKASLGFSDPQFRNKLDKLFGRVGGFVVGCSDHPEAVLNPLLFGWALESYLQQLGLTYMVENELYDGSYSYDPNKKRIIFGKTL